jgi:hypothetical protein
MAKDALANATAERENAVAMAERAADEKYQELLTEYKAKILAHREITRAWGVEHRAWQAKMDAMSDTVKAWEARRDAYYADLGVNLGVIYAYMSDAGPRGINGYPMFTSCGFLHTEDWKVVLAAIKREQAREIDLGDETPDT